MSSLAFAVGDYVTSLSRPALGLGRVISCRPIAVVVDWPNRRTQCSYSLGQNVYAKRDGKDTYRVHNPTDLKLASPLVALAHSLEGK